MPALIFIIGILLLLQAPILWAMGYVEGSDLTTCAMGAFVGFLMLNYSVSRISGR